MQTFRPILSVVPESASAPSPMITRLQPHPSAAGERRLTPLTRSRGALRVSFKKRGDRTVLDTLYQAGCSKLRLPNPDGDAAPVAIVINTGGGLTGGDVTALTVRWKAETEACVSTQAAEKIYRSLAGNAEVHNQLHIEAGAAAEWLPQETILFDRARLDRAMRVELARNASFLGLESVVLGRTAMGEDVRSGHFRDSWQIERDGLPVYSDIALLSGDIGRLMDRPAVGNGARAFATLILVGEDLTAAFLDALREILNRARGLAAASLWNGILAVRFLARDGDILRRDVAQALHFVRRGRALPKVWQC